MKPSQTLDDYIWNFGDRHAYCEWRKAVDEKERIGTDRRKAEVEAFHEIFDGLKLPECFKP